jgi:1,4-alpha-glucan branching enzyme
MNITLEKSKEENQATNGSVEVVKFFYAAPEAEAVYLMGDFNDWNPASHRMQRAGGWWYLQVPLTRGHHQYKFVVDGTPRLDPHAAGMTRNGRYHQVSIVAVN